MNVSQIVRFTVFGIAAPRGSKHAIPKARKDGSLYVGVQDSSERSNDWMHNVSASAAAVYRGPLIEGPVRLTATFYFARPKKHFYQTVARAGELRDDAPKHHSQQPDLAKLLRAVEDGITGVVWRDDKQIACYGEQTGKCWTNEQARVEVTIETLDDHLPRTMPLFD